ncbi:helix-turn-helix transcriptional regulator [Tardiphaga alba]|uniref:Helix-turn-helix transcriptional regulator n=1 Tax=Tardiphaga alba TaxID=340268 RepID=A0ABX8AAT6_9BRAD|nr:helix-turn-helix transcriptional regulator [Tardiphaga alba]QUS40342.1 helix-turn-helix transcriptional regulator [Tardiphaga alba]
MPAVELLSDELLIERIYEAAVVPGLWKPILDQIAYRVGASGTGLYLLSERADPIGIWSDAIDDICTGWIKGGWQARTQRAPRMMSLNYAGFLTDSDIYSPGEMESDEAFTQYLKPNGFGYGAGTGINMPTGETAVFSIERRFEDGPLSRKDCLALDPLRPHLARAALLSVRTSRDRAQMLTGTLETLGLPGAVIRTNGRLLSANDMFDRLMPAVVQDRRDRLRLTSPQADILFSEALHGIRTHTSPKGVTSIPIAARADTPPLIFHLLPTPRAAQDILLSACAILIVTPVDRSIVPGANVLQGLFDLTPAEARVAHSVGSAVRIEEIASVLGVSRETVRAQLKSVLAKTGMRRQGELISLLAGKTLPDSSSDSNE